MKYRVRLTAKAEADVDGVLRWFQEQQASVAGGRWFARLLAKIDTLETHPGRCGVADESNDLGIEIRQLLGAPFALTAPHSHVLHSALFDVKHT